jgi:methyltransferase (TIGR00027 family)
MVDLWRALADSGLSVVPNFTDPFVHELLDGIWGVAWRGLRWATGRMDARGRARFSAGYGAMPIRVAFIDARLEAGVRTGIRQVVVLGAGLDTRAWRLRSLAGCRLFEVDHPATQRHKRARVDRFPPPIADVAWAAVDFERDDLASALAAAGHDPKQPTVWLWEGVVMYLGDAALRATLAAVAGRSAPGSVLVLHYHEPDASSRRVRRLFLAVVGEPQIGLRTQAAIQRELVAAGLEVVEDAGVAEQAAAVGATVPDNNLARVSRICVARRR